MRRRRATPSTEDASRDSTHDTFKNFDTGHIGGLSDRGVASFLKRKFFFPNFLARSYHLWRILPPVPYLGPGVYGGSSIGGGDFGSIVPFFSKFRLSPKISSLSTFLPHMVSYRLDFDHIRTCSAFYVVYTFFKVFRNSGL